MKKIIILLMGIILLTGCGKVKKYTGNLKYFHFGHGSGFPTYVDHTIECIDDVCSYKYTLHNGADTEDMVYGVAAKHLRELKDIINENKVSRWDGFNKRAKNIMDGDSFSFNVKFDDNHEINASGYMKYPKDYKEVISKIDELLSEMRNE